MNRTRSHVPVRTCVGCGQTDRQSDLVRLSRSVEGRICLARRGQAKGRSAYLHPSPGCWRNFLSRGGSIRSLRTTLDKSERAALFEQYREREGARPPLEVETA